MDRRIVRIGPGLDLSRGLHGRFFDAEGRELRF
jgi:hypothetical protein